MFAKCLAALSVLLFASCGASAQEPTRGDMIEALKKLGTAFAVNTRQYVREVGFFTPHQFCWKDRADYKELSRLGKDVLEVAEEIDRLFPRDLWGQSPYLTILRSLGSSRPPLRRFQVMCIDHSTDPSSTAKRSPLVHRCSELVYRALGIFGIYPGAIVPWKRGRAC